jgi:hypothetical protein
MEPLNQPVLQTNCETFHIASKSFLGEHCIGCGEREGTKRFRRRLAKPQRYWYVYFVLGLGGLIGIITSTNRIRVDYSLCRSCRKRQPKDIARGAGAIVLSTVAVMISVALVGAGRGLALIAVVNTIWGFFFAVAYAIGRPNPLKVIHFESGGALMTWNERWHPEFTPKSG